MDRNTDIQHIKTISHLMRKLGLPTPSHPLVALVDYSEVAVEALDKGEKLFLDFYKISYKPNFKGQTKYGQGQYDFEEGGLAFLAPRQVVFTPEDLASYEGFALYFHPDFIRNSQLGKAIRRYGFFSYDVSEALCLSAREKQTVGNLFASIAEELKNNIDHFSQDVLVSQIELLLHHSNRFYSRQFITRKTVSHDIVSALDRLLDEYMQNGNNAAGRLPSVKEISTRLNVSPRYLSDMMRSLTGLNTQQYIQNAQIERAKEKLSTSFLSVSEIAYELGFEHPQSFSKLFKAKTKLSPLAFRKSFN